MNLMKFSGFADRGIFQLRNQHPNAPHIIISTEISAFKIHAQRVTLLKPVVWSVKNFLFDLILISIAILKVTGPTAYRQEHVHKKGKSDNIQTADRLNLFQAVLPIKLVPIQNVLGYHAQTDTSQNQVIISHICFDLLTNNTEKNLWHLFLAEFLSSLHIPILSAV